MSTLTKAQQELADLLFTTKTHAKVRRRKQNADGSYEFYLITRDTSPVDFRVDPGEFVFKHHEVTPGAPLSPMYVNLRSLPDNVLAKIGEVMSQIPLEDTPDLGAGIPKAADSIAKKYARFSGIPLVTIFDKEDGEQKRRIIPAAEAPRGNGKKLLIIDDLITKAGSKLEAIKVAEDLDYTVVGVIVLVDREEGGFEELQEKGYRLYAALRLTDLLTYYLDKHMITKEQFNETIVYLESSKKL